eukprot:Polyplicarium_translucidae@DN2717_c0_g1_i3.p1
MSQVDAQLAKLEVLERCRSYLPVAESKRSFLSPAQFLKEEDESRLEDFLNPANTHDKRNRPSCVEPRLLDRFAEPEVIDGALAEAEKLFKDGKMSAGELCGMGVVDTFRSDVKVFIGPDMESSCPNLWAIREKVREFKDQLEPVLHSKFGRRFGAMSCQVACFPEGARFFTHLDAHDGDPRRRFLTLVAYLNNDWTPEDAGWLEAFHEDQRYRVLPRGGRAVLFRSDLTEHRVLASNRPRYAVASWVALV